MLVFNSNKDQLGATITNAPETDPSSDLFDLDTQKTDLVAAPEEANLKETGPFATAQTVQPKHRVRAR